MRDAVEEFLNYNRPFAKRHPELYRVKVARMAESAFAFLRGTFHLYAKDVIEQSVGQVPILLHGVEMPLVGDIHGENYGTYQAEDSKVYYDINDFDETTHGRVGFDVCRLTVSWFLAAREHGASLRQAVEVSLAVIGAYTEALPRCVKKGLDHAVREGSPSGCAPIDELVAQGAATKRKDFIAKLTQVKNDKRRLIRNVHYFSLPQDENDQAVRLLSDYISRQPPPPSPDFYAVHDVCGRVAGIGSMGRLRYVLLVSGKGNAEGRNVLLEFKESRPSAYDVYRQREIDDKAVARRAEEVARQQRQAQAASSSYLGFAVDGAMSFQAREIGPHDLRLDPQKANAPGVAEKVAGEHATILARAHARAASQTVGLVNPLAELSDPDVFGQRVLTFALGYADRVQQDYARFVGHRTELDAFQG